MPLQHIQTKVAFVLTAALFLLSGPASAQITAKDSTSFVSRFQFGHDSYNWAYADNLVDNPWQKTYRSPRNMRFDKDGLSILLEPRDRPDSPFKSGEYVSKQVFTSGRFEIVMQPIEQTGVASNFILYRGPDAEHGVEEIGLQFFGNTPNTVNFILVVDGKRIKNPPYRLEHKTTEGFHLYAFERSETGVKWFVGGELAYEHVFEEPRPDLPGARLLANAWAATKASESWLGPVDFTEAQALRVRCMSYRAPGEIKEQCSSRFAD